MMVKGRTVLRLINFILRPTGSLVQVKKCPRLDENTTAICANMMYESELTREESQQMQNRI